MEAINNYLVVKKEIIEEKRSAGGIILNVPSAFDFGEEFTNRNICFGEVMFDNNENIPFLQVGERIAMNPHKGQMAAMDYEEFTIITGDQFLAKIDKEGKFIVAPNSVMVMISNIDKENLYSKWIIRDDGEKVQLFFQSPLGKDNDNRSTRFVSLGEIVQVGDNVKDIYYGDIAILDYTVDNFTDNVLYYDDEKNKYVVIDGTTTFHTGDHWVYANRQHKRDTLVSKKGDQDISSPLLGVIRNDKLIAREPYVFLNHKSNESVVVSKQGIIYSKTENILEHEVLSVSGQSNLKYGLKQGQTIIVDDYDVFDVKLKDDKIQCILDSDVLMGKI